MAFALQPNQRAGGFGWSAQRFQGNGLPATASDLVTHPTGRQTPYQCAATLARSVSGLFHFCRESWPRFPKLQVGYEQLIAPPCRGDRSSPQSSRRQIPTGGLPLNTPNYPPEIFSAWATGITPKTSSIPFAIDGSGILREVDEVERGKNCHCRCPQCGGPVLARQGEVRVHHFAHHSRRECFNALETSLYQATIGALTRPDAQLRLPPLGDRRELAQFHGAYFDRRQAAKFFAHQWVIEPETVPMSGVEVMAATIADSVPAKPDLVVPATGLHIHLLTFRKEAQAIREAIADSVTAAIGIDLRAYAKLWWDACSRDRDSQARRAGEALRHWLANEETGRGWLSHQLFEERMVSLSRWAQKHRLAPILPPAPPRPPSPPPAPLLPQRHQLAVPPAPAVLRKDQPNRVIEPAVGVCPLCKAPTDKVELGSGFYAGRVAIVCSVNQRHPMQLAPSAPGL